MATQTAEQTTLRGGEWLIKKSTPADTFTPDSWNEEQRNMAEMIRDFLEQEILPNVEKLDKWEDPNLMPTLLKKAGELGILSTGVPEEYGGLGLDFTTNMLTTEITGAGHSFSVGMAAHTGIGTLPILYYGTDAQKEKYLPKLASGELLSSYCLTEPDSGSDALSAKTKAVLNEAGTHYILNGQKMWITNGGFADVFTVFAQVDGEHFTGFIVERDYPGISFGEEEDKMGIKGSSTRQVFFNDAEVPKENLLGEIGKGHHIAFNILNIGRMKLGAAVLGSAKDVITKSVSYANERKQFGTNIGSFGAIQHKLAEQAIRTWVVESGVYRATDWIRQHLESAMANGMPYTEAIQAAAREYAVECAMMKVAASEALDYVVDEGVQIYGGYGFSAEYPMDRAYRDSRINRIFEGTNEINRMLTLNDLLKKAMKGEIDLFGAAMSIQKELTSMPSMGGNGDAGPLSREHEAVENFKKAGLMVAGLAAQTHQQALANHQEILMYLADMVIQTYLAESAVLRAQKLLDATGDDAAHLTTQMTQVFVTDAADRIAQAGRNVLYNLASGDTQMMTLMGLKRFTKVAAFDTIGARRAIAQAMLAQNRYIW